MLTLCGMSETELESLLKKKGGLSDSVDQEKISERERREGTEEREGGRRKRKIMLLSPTLFLEEYFPTSNHFFHCGTFNWPEIWQFPEVTHHWKLELWPRVTWVMLIFFFTWEPSNSSYLPIIVCWRKELVHDLTNQHGQRRTNFLCWYEIRRNTFVMIVWATVTYFPHRCKEF